MRTMLLQSMLLTYLHPGTVLGGAPVQQHNSPVYTSMVSTCSSEASPIILRVSYSIPDA